jgi:hypothetical protein
MMAPFNILINNKSPRKFNDDIQNLTKSQSPSLSPGKAYFFKPKEIKTWATIRMKETALNFLKNYKKPELNP